MFSSTGEAQARAPEVAALRGDVGFGQAEDEETTVLQRRLDSNPVFRKHRGLASDKGTTSFDTLPP